MRLFRRLSTERRRIDDAIYELEAARVTEVPERESVLSFVATIRPQTAVLFRFTPRS